MGKPRIIVKVAGSMVRAVYSSDTNVEVDVLDYDNMLDADIGEEEYAGYKKLEEEIPNLKEVW